MTTELTDRQRELLDFIVQTVSFDHRMPSYREMAKALKVSAVGTIQDHVRVLVERGYMKRTDKGIALSGARHSPSMSIPILGEVAAGSLQDSYELALGALPLSPELLQAKGNPADFFALRVKGDSMIDAGIFEKDYVIVNRRLTAKTGDIVVVSLRGEATVKELLLPKKSGGAITLLPHNKKLQPIVISGDEDFRVLGRVVSVQRYL